MPYRWTEPTSTHPLRLTLWPHRSLPRRHMAWFLAATAVLLALPLLSEFGTPGLWVMLPFLATALAGVWFALEKSYRDGEVVEVMTLTPDRVDLTRRSRGEAPRDWQANPYWVRPHLYRQGGPVPNYLTLKGGTREVELGAFLSEEERVSLKAELEARLADLRALRPDAAARPWPTSPAAP
jgi:uncharacterized membrane protein